MLRDKNYCSAGNVESELKVDQVDFWFICQRIPSEAHSDPQFHFFLGQMNHK